MIPSPPTADGKLRSFRPSTRAAITLACMMAAHALLETARDGLFLSHVSAAELPWAYLAIALGTALASASMARVRSRIGADRTLVLILWVAALGVLAVHPFVQGGARLSYHFLYVWCGVASSAAILEFWLALGKDNTITEGKRRYATIALGGSIGAVSGFGLAAALTRLLPAESMLPISAALFGLSSVGPLYRMKSDPLAHPRGADPIRSREWADPGHQPLLRLAAEPYARGIVILLALATFVFSLADFLFKSSIGALVDPQDLTSWLGGVYLGLNLSSTLVLALFVTPALRRVGLQRALLLAPILFAIGGLGSTLGGGLLGVGLLKMTEGVLRHSLHRTTGELLFLPLADRDRAAAKTLGEVLGDKGSKAAAALAILAIIPFDDAQTWLAGLLTVSSIAWLGMALALRRPYLDVFRRTLSAETIVTRLELPSLDVQSLGTLIRALDHPEEKTVQTAITLLQERERVDLIPSLILYHPSGRIVQQALEVFAQAGRDDFRAHLDRLLVHPDACVRAAATRAIALVEPDRERLEILRRSECPCIRVSAVAGLLAHGWIDPQQACDEFDATLDEPDREARLALATSARLFHSAHYRKVLVALAHDSDASVRREAILAINDSRDEEYNEELVRSLGDRVNRDVVRRALLARGTGAFDALSSALGDWDLPTRAKLPIPDVLARFAHPEAARVLVEALSSESSGAIRFKILRALLTLRASPAAWERVDLRVLDRILGETIERALSLLHWQREVGAARNDQPDYKTHGGEILDKLLRDKERLATQRVFLLLDLLYPEEDFEEIRIGLASEHRRSRASALELLDNLLEPRRARAIAALASTAPTDQRLSAVEDPRRDTRISLAALLRRLGSDRSKSLRALATYYAAEIGLTSSRTLDLAIARARAAERITSLQS